MSKETKPSFLALAIILFLTLGITFAGSLGGWRVFALPVFAICVAIAFVIQWLAFIHAYLKQTEKFYDLTGASTYLAVVIVGCLLSSPVDTRSLLLSGLISVWAIRLGSFLFLRIRAAGGDRRFGELKRSFSRFLLTWTMQGLWVVYSLAAALAVITSRTRVALDAFAGIGLSVWLIGFLIEVIADRQKRQFKAQPENKDKFIHSGLWSWSRHPNYFGEIVLWIGIAIIALPVLRGWQWAALSSPIFVIILLTKISGIPILEKQADERWGGQVDYESYKANASILILIPPRHVLTTKEKQRPRAL